MTNEELVTETEKARITSTLIQEAPPGEFNEVWNDLRILLNNDQLMNNMVLAAAQYHKDQLLAVQYDSSLPKTLLTNYNELPEGRFFDPNSKKSFKYNFLSKSASDVQPYDGPHVDEKLEAFRKAVQQELDGYIQEHYHNYGIGVVYVFNGHLAIAIESHIFKPKKFWNGRWRSQWEIPGLEKSETIEINGISRINVHYYEDGNVQLSTKKDLTVQAKYSSDPVETAKNVVGAIEKAESVFENAIIQNYNVMSMNSQILSLLDSNETSNSTDVSINSTATPSVVSLVNTTVGSLSTTSESVNTTHVSVSTLSPLTTLTPVDDDSHTIFAFCTILFVVGIALVMKIVYSNRKKYSNLTPSIPSWRLSASRSSANIPAGFALSRDSFAPRTARGEAFASAHYSAVPPSTSARLSSHQDAFMGNSTAQLEWERQFFDDDVPNDNDRNTRLELRR